MNFEINRKEEKKEEPVEIYLERTGDYVHVRARRRDISTSLLFISPYGTLSRCYSVDETLGFQLDDYGKIIER